MVKHTQNCVWPFCEIDALKLNQSKVLEIQTRSCRIQWLWKSQTSNVFNPFVPNVLFPYPWKRQKTWNETLGENELLLIVKGVLRTQSNMYEGAFKWISLAAKTTVSQLFLQKSYIIDVLSDAPLFAIRTFLNCIKYSRIQDFIWPVYFRILAKYRNLLAAEPCSEPCQMYNMELFGK